jgi:hypothetical protein
VEELYETKPLAMLKLYFSSLALTLLTIGTSSCSKDFLKSYDNRIPGTWQLTDINRVGIGGNTGDLPFQDGQFEFSEGGGLVYTNAAGRVYKGSWDIRKQWMRGSCTTDDDGRQQCDDRQVSLLELTAVDFVSQDVRTIHFDEIRFTGTNKFKAYIYDGWRTYVFHFRG